MKNLSFFNSTVHVAIHFDSTLYSVSTAYGVWNQNLHEKKTQPPRALFSYALKEGATQDMFILF